MLTHWDGSFEYIQASTKDIGIYSICLKPYLIHAYIYSYGDAKSNFWTEPLSIFILYVCEQHRHWWDFMGALLLPIVISTIFSSLVQSLYNAPQWGAWLLSDRVLDSRLGVVGSSLTGDAVLCSWARHFILCLVLVQPRKTRPYITESLLMGHKESNQTKQNPRKTHPDMTEKMLTGM